MDYQEIQELIVKVSGVQDVKAAAAAFAAEEDALKELGRTINTTKTAHDALGQGAAGAVGGHRNLTQAFMAAQYAAQDFSSASGGLGEKLNSISNNIPQIAMGLGFGGPWGIAIAGASVGLIALYRNLDSITGWFVEKKTFPKAAHDVSELKRELENAHASMKKLEGAGNGTAAELEKLNGLRTRAVEIEKQISKEMEKQGEIKKLLTMEAPGARDDEKERTASLQDSLGGQQDDLEKRLSKALNTDNDEKRRRGDRAAQRLTDRVNSTEGEEQRKAMQELKAQEKLNAAIPDADSRRDEARDVLAGAMVKGDLRSFRQLQDAQLRRPELFTDQQRGAVAQADPDAIARDKALDQGFEDRAAQVKARDDKAKAKKDEDAAYWKKVAAFEAGNNKDAGKGAADHAKEVGEQVGVFGGQFGGPLRDAALKRLAAGQGDKEISEALGGQVKGRLGEFGVSDGLQGDTAAKIVQAVMTRLKAEIAAKAGEIPAAKGIKPGAGKAPKGKAKGPLKLAKSIPADQAAAQALFRDLQAKGEKAQGKAQGPGQGQMLPDGMPQGQPRRQAQPGRFSVALGRFVAPPARPGHKLPFGIVDPNFKGKAKPVMPGAPIPRSVPLPLNLPRVGTPNLQRGQQAATKADAAAEAMIQAVGQQNQFLTGRLEVLGQKLAAVTSVVKGQGALGVQVALGMGNDSNSRLSTRA